MIPNGSTLLLSQQSMLTLYSKAHISLSHIKYDDITKMTFDKTYDGIQLNEPQVVGYWKLVLGITLTVWVAPTSLEGGKVDPL